MEKSEWETGRNMGMEDCNGLLQFNEKNEKTAVTDSIIGKNSYEFINNWVIFHSDSYKLIRDINRKKFYKIFKIWIHQYLICLLYVFCMHYK